MKFFLIVLFGLSLSAHAETVYMRPSEALKIIFSQSKEVVQDKKQLSPDQIASIQKTTGQKLSKTEWTFFIAKTGDHIDGYALVDNEIGKTEPITFLTAIDPFGKVLALEVLVYRESHGGEVKQERFRKQFHGKTASDPIKIHQDIQHISGATLSSSALSRGAKRALAIWQTLYQSKP